MACAGAALRRVVVVLVVGVVALVLSGCFAIGLGAGVNAKKSDMVGTWRSSCGETVVMRKDGTGTITGFLAFTPPYKPISTPQEVTWWLSSDTGPLSLDIGDSGWLLQVTRKHGKLRLIYGTDKKPCMFTKDQRR